MMRNSIFIATLFLLCLPIFAPVANAQAAAPLTVQQRAVLEQQLQQVEADEKAANDQLSAAQSQSASLSRDIAILDAKIKAAQLDIKAKNLLIQTLGSDITDKQSHINALEDKIARGKETLAAILRKTNEVDAYSLPEIILSQTSVAGFFQDLDTFQSVQDGIKSTFAALRSDEASTTVEKEALTVRQNAAIDAKYAIQQQQKNIQADQAQQKQLLAISKGNEQSYSAVVMQKAAQAAQIRAALFSLAGGSNPIPFGVALKYAQFASAKTGVSPAFLLAILTQESNLGANVGKCYLTNPGTGDGINVTDGTPSSNVMNPNRDVGPFMEITKSLGLSPSQTVVSCQQPSVGGWGGAMGPAQFIASTWTLLSDRVAKELGVSTANPWDPQHAIMAEALFMADLGASGGGYTAELTAACRYFGGGTKCRSSTKPYANNVMFLAYTGSSKTPSIQSQINLLD